MRRLLIAIFLLLFTPIAHAQTLIVHLINAKTGNPISRQNVTVRWDNTFEETVVFTDEKGMAHFEVPQGATSLSLMEGPNVGKDPYRLAYLDCNDNVGNIPIQT